MKTKDSNETIQAFSTMLTEKNRPKQSWVEKGKQFEESLKKLEEYKFTIQYVSLSLHLLNIQHNP